MAKKSKKSKTVQQEVIGPDGNTTFQYWMDKLRSGSLADTLYLVGGVIAVVIGLIMLSHIAI